MTLAFESISLSNNWAPWLSLLLDFALKGTAIILAAALLVTLLRRASAATRHLVLSLSIASLLALPALSVLLPAWQVPITWTAFQTKASAPQVDSVADVAAGAMPQPRRTRENRARIDLSPMMTEGLSPVAASKVGAAELGESELDAPQAPVNWSALLLAIWLAGTFAVLVRLVIGTARVWWLARNAEALTDAPWADLAESLSKNLGLNQPVKLLKSKRVAMPLTCGTLRPAVLVPIDTFDWSNNRKQVVLKHELAHVKRRDCLTQMVANFVCALYWFNPAVWLAARQLRIERERACDDCVLESGTRPSEYADHLLDLARSFGSARCSTFAAVAIAKRSQLEGRLLAILDPRVRRRSPNRAKSVLISMVVLGLAFPLGALRLTARTNDPVKAGTPASAPEIVRTTGNSRPGDAVLVLASPRPAGPQPAIDEVTDLQQPAGKYDAAMGTGLGLGAGFGEGSGLGSGISGGSAGGSGEGSAAGSGASGAAAPQDDRKDARSIESLRNALKDEDAQVRYQALMVLVRLHDKSVGDEIKSALKDKDPQMRAQAAWALGINGDDSAIALLISALTDESNQVRSQAAWALGLKGDKSAVEPLIAALKDADEHVRSQAAWALGLKGDSRAADALAAALQDQSGRVRSQAAWALGLKGGKNAVDALIAALRDQDEHVRSQAAWALGLKGDGRAAEGLIAALKDSSSHVRSQAAWALGLKGDQRAADALSAAMKDIDQQVRREAARALGLILMRFGEAKGSAVEKEKEDENDDDDDNGAPVSPVASVRVTAATAGARIEAKIATTTRARIETGMATTTVTTTTRAPAARKSGGANPPR